MEIDVQNENGQTQLMEMCLKGDFKMVHHLINSGADLDIIDHNRENALMYAIRNPNNKDCVEKLVSLTRNIRLHNKNEETSLMIAVKLKRLKYASILLRRYPPLVNFQDYMGNPPLYHAMVNRDCKMVKSLLKYKANIQRRNVNGVTPLELIKDFPEMREMMNPYLPKSIRSYNTPNWSEALLAACRHKLPIWVRHWIGKGGCVNYRNNKRETPLYWVIIKQDPISLTFLLHYNVNIHSSIFRYSYLHLSISMNNFIAFKILIKYGIDINNVHNNRKRTPLMHAAQQGRISFVKKLIEQKVDLDRQDEYGVSALMMAIKSHHYDVADILINAKCDVNLRDYGRINNRYTGYNALMIATVMNSEYMIKKLVEVNANVNYENNNGKTALYITICNKNEQMITYLIDHKADVNHRDTKGNSLLTHSIIDESANICRILIKNGAYIHIKNLKKNSPYQFVKFAPTNKEIVSMMDTEYNRLKELWKSILYKLLGGFYR